jgi:hypothetical protein
MASQPPQGLTSTVRVSRLLRHIGCGTTGTTAARGGEERSSSSSFQQQRQQKAIAAAAAAAAAASWTLIYWPSHMGERVFAGAGRGEYVRVIFEEAQVEYREESDPTRLQSFFGMADDGAAATNSGFPMLAPPAVQDPSGAFQMSQTADIARYLGRQFGLFPTDPQDQAHADQILSTIHDFIAEGRLSFHPVKNTMVRVRAPRLSCIWSQRCRPLLRHHGQQAAGACMHC